MKKQNAFTLIELLVVIAIIALLLSVVVPALRRVKQQATGAVCLSNIRQLSIAWHTFATENNQEMVHGHVPRGPQQEGYNASHPYWVSYPQNEAGAYRGEPAVVRAADEKRGIEKGALFPYLGTLDVYKCPGDKSSLRFAGTHNNPDKGWLNSYSVTALMNGEAGIGSNPDPRTAKRISSVSNPGSKVVFLENVDDRGWLMGSWMMNYVAPSWVDPIAIWHKDRGTLGFADGHAEMRNWRDKSTIANAEAGSAVISVPAAGESGEDIRFMQSAYVPGRR